jgi:hypothetical protein
LKLLGKSLSIHSYSSVPLPSPNRLLQSECIYHRSFNPLSSPV